MVVDDRKETNRPPNMQSISEDCMSIVSKGHEKEECNVIPPVCRPRLGENVYFVYRDETRRIRIDSILDVTQSIRANILQCPIVQGINGGSWNAIDCIRAHGRRSFCHTLFTMWTDDRLRSVLLRRTNVKAC